MKTKEKKFLSQVALVVFVTFSGVTAKYDHLEVIFVCFPHNILDNSNKSCSFASEIKKV